jgi:hypothetical protein
MVVSLIQLYRNIYFVSSLKRNLFDKKFLNNILKIQELCVPTEILIRDEIFLLRIDNFDRDASRIGYELYQEINFQTILSNVPLNFKKTNDFIIKPK